MPTTARRGGKSKYSASPPNSGNSLKSPPKKKFHPIFSINGVNATNSMGSATNDGTRRKAGNNVRATHATGQVSNTVQTNNMFNVGNKTLEEVTKQDESMDGNSDDDNVDHNGDKSAHTNTCIEKKKIAPIVVLGAQLCDVKEMLLKVVADKKIVIRITVIGHRINLIDADDFIKVKTALDEMVKTGKAIGYYSYHTPDTRPHKIMLFGLYKMEKNELMEKLKQSGVTPVDISTIKMAQRGDQQVAYLLYFAPGQERLANLRKIKHIDNVIVHWEKYEPRRQDKVPQCRICQMYGHSSVNCKMSPFCMVCSEGHKTNDCPKKIQRATIKWLESEGNPISRQHIRCANYGGQHTASFKGCIMRQGYIEIQ